MVRLCFSGIWQIAGYRSLSTGKLTVWGSDDGRNWEASTHVETIEDRAGATQIQRVNSVVLRSGQGPMVGSGGDWQSTQPGQGAAVSTPTKF